MHIIRNERRLRIYHTVGRFTPWIALAVLAAGLIVPIRPGQSMLPFLLIVPAGLALSVLGGFFADRYVGPLAHHEALARVLKGLDSSHTLIQHVLPATHVLLSPGGCTVFVVKSQGGRVVYEEDRWKHRQRGKIFRQLAGQEAVGVPDYEAARQVRKLERWLAKQLPEVEIPVQAAIVFVNPDVDLEADAPPVPAFYGKKVKAWLRGPGKLKPLPHPTYELLATTLGVVSEETDHSA